MSDPVIFGSKTNINQSEESNKCPTVVMKRNSKVKKRELRPGCKNCSRNCQTHFTLEERQAIHNEFQNIEKRAKKRQFLSKLVTLIDVKQRRAEPSSSRRMNTFEYRLPSKGRLIQVCKVFFMHTVGVGEHLSGASATRVLCDPKDDMDITRNKKSLRSTCQKDNSFVVAVNEIKQELAPDIEVSPNHNIKVPKSLCAEKCSCNCNKNVCDSDRANLFDFYWNLDEDEQKCFLRDSVKIVSIGDQYSGAQQKKVCYIDWTFMVNGHCFSVCRPFYLSTLDIPKQVVFAALMRDLPGPDCDSDNIVFITTKTGRLSKTVMERPFKTDSMLGPGCQKCRLNCQSKFSTADRQEMFDQFRRLTTKAEQIRYLAMRVLRTHPYRNMNAVNHNRKKCVFVWTLLHNGERIKVCKTYFHHTLGFGINRKTAYCLGFSNKFQDEFSSKSSVMSQLKHENETMTTDYDVPVTDDLEMEEKLSNSSQTTDEVEIEMELATVNDTQYQVQESDMNEQNKQTVHPVALISHVGHSTPFCPEFQSLTAVQE